MKKHISIKKWLIVPLVLVGIASPLLFLTSCSDNESFTSNTYTIASNEVKSLLVKVEDREVNVNTSNSKEIKITYFVSSKEFYNLSLSESSELHMQSAYSKNWTDYIGMQAALEYRKIFIELPTSFLSDLIISTTNEKIQCNALEVSNSISLTSDNGDLEFSQIAVENSLSVNVKNGNINGSVIGDYDQFAISCEIKRGKTNLPLKKETGNKALKAVGNNGDINITFIG